MVSAALLIASGVQGGNAPAPDYETLAIVLLIAILSAACVAIALYLRRRQLRSRPVADQWQALAAMRELCPHGWRARLTLYGSDAALPAEAPVSRVRPVALEWSQFEGGLDVSVVERRLWAPTIGEALQAMVEDRRTDTILEQIEQAAHDPRWLGD